MADPVLHYVYDPLCGWCYAAEPLVEAASAAGVRVLLHGGGLWDPAVHASDAKRLSMRETDARISELTGQPFGPAYLDGLLVDPASTWWSHPTITAVLAADAIENGKGLAMIGAVQRAHYVEGRRVVDDAVLADAAGSIGLDRSRFLNALPAAPVDAHIAATRKLMRGHGLQGFPSFLLEREGEVTRLAHEACYGRPDTFVALIGQGVPAHRRPERTSPTPLSRALTTPTFWTRTSGSIALLDVRARDRRTSTGKPNASATRTSCRPTSAGVRAA